MEIWDRKRYEVEKRRFIQQRINLAPLWSQFTLVFAASWASAWFASWTLLHYFAVTHAWAGSLPVRYAIAFVFAYGCFFLAVRVWIDCVRHEPHQQNESIDLSGGNFGGDAEGCFMLMAVIILGFIAGGLFFAVGGAPMLLEAAFEAAFAGVVVRRLSGEFKLGDWKKRLFANTWMPALISFIVLIAAAAWLQRQAPQAMTFAEAVRTMTKAEKNNR
jgi:hypothetical protein